MNVYVVTEGSYSSRHIEGIFSTEEKAKAYMECRKRTSEYIDSLNMVKWTLDKINKDVRHVEIAWDLETDEIETDSVVWLEEDCVSGSRFYYCLDLDHPVFAIADEKERTQALLKIAQDRYAEYKAREEGIT